MMNRLRNLPLWLFATALTLSSMVHASSELDGIMKTKLENLLAAVSVPGEEAQQQLSESIDFRSITRGVLGQHRKTATDEQLQRFQAEFEKSMVGLLRAALETAGDYEIEVSGSKLSKKNDERGQVYATVTTEDGQRIDLVSSVALLDGDWKVRNLIFGGVNLGKTYRSQFDQLVQENSGDLDLAIAAWSQHTIDAGVAAD